MLYAIDEHRDRIGTFSNVLFHCDDIQQIYEALKARGCRVSRASDSTVLGLGAVFKDPDGNSYSLGQRGE